MMPPASCRQCLRQTQVHVRLASSPMRTTSPSSVRSSSRLFSSTNSGLRSPASTPNNPLRSSSSTPRNNGKNQAAQEKAAIAHYRRRMALSAAGMAICALTMYATIKSNVFGLPEDDSSNQETKKKKKKTDEQGGEGTQQTHNNGNAIKLDGPSEFPSSPSVIRVQGQDGAEQVETGNSAVPLFPTTIKLPKSISDVTVEPGQDLAIPPESEEEYQLLGFGIRSVSFLSIQVYVVGFYVAKSDIGALQQRLIQTGVQAPSSSASSSSSASATLNLAGQAGAGAVAATSLVSTEREALKKLLLDPENSEEAWTSILKEGNIRTAVRIAPTRNTDFMHLRDAWVRHMTNRAQKDLARVKGLSAAAAAAAKTGEHPPPAPLRSEFDDEAFGQAIGEFKVLLGGGSRKSIPKGQVLLLLRDQKGTLDALFQRDPKEPIQWLGRVADERVSRCVWLNYLAGKQVASEPARQSIVDGVMGIVERPVGTVIQKVI